MIVTSANDVHARHHKSWERENVFINCLLSQSNICKPGDADDFDKISEVLR